MWWACCKHVANMLQNPWKQMKTGSNLLLRTGRICEGLSWLAWCGMGGSCNDTLRPVHNIWTNPFQARKSKKLTNHWNHRKSLECYFSPKSSECASKVKTIDDRYEEVMSETSWRSENERQQQGKRFHLFYIISINFLYPCFVSKDGLPYWFNLHVISCHIMSSCWSITGVGVFQSVPGGQLSRSAASAFLRISLSSQNFENSSISQHVPGCHPSWKTGILTRRINALSQVVENILESN
jgi:hypothetical protein